jgi:hypothetical protein
MIASIEQLIFEIQQTQIPPPTTPTKRSRWTRKDEALFEQVFCLELSGAIEEGIEVYLKYLPTTYRVLLKQFINYSEFVVIEC